MLCVIYPVNVDLTYFSKEHLGKNQISLQISIIVTPAHISSTIRNSRSIYASMSLLTFHYLSLPVQIFHSRAFLVICLSLFFSRSLSILYPVLRILILYYMKVHLQLSNLEFQEAILYLRQISALFDSSQALTDERLRTKYSRGRPKFFLIFGFIFYYFCILNLISFKTIVYF